MLEAAPNPISEKEEYTPALLVTTQCTMFPDLIKILHLAISGLSESKMPWHPPIMSDQLTQEGNPISTRGEDYAHHITTGLPGFRPSYGPASLTPNFSR